jgi:class III cytochrome C family protein
MKTRDLIGGGFAVLTLVICFAARAAASAQAAQNAAPPDPSQLETSVHKTLECTDCHGAEILSSKDPKSPTYQLNLAATCSRCHNDAKTKMFADSIHGRALARSGLIVAPTCTDCHGTHDVKKVNDPQSRVARANVPATCAKCHEGIGHQFGSGVHGRLLAEGKGGVPACQTCHTAHAIQRAESTGWQLSVIGQCGTCHADRIETFRDTFHGQVTNLGFRSVAGCADCHGAHEILPASDPRSPVSPGRLVATCGKCHANANASFVKYDPHANKHDARRSRMLYFTARFMTVLLAGVFTFFGLHSTLWFSKEWRLKRARRRGGAR